MPETLKARFDDIVFEGTLFKADADNSRPLLFCLPGGGAGKGFFDLTPDHSFAKLMNGLGYDVLTMDHPGTASNPLPESRAFLKPRGAADMINWALTKFIEQKWTDGRDVIGVGHSMGGFITTLIQARHRPYKALTLLGSNAGGLDWGLTEDEKEYIGKPELIEAELEKLTLAKFGEPFPKNVGGGPSGKSIVFGAENPECLRALRHNTCELFAAGGMMSMIHGSFKREVEAIDVPMFFAFGDHDIGIPPEDAPKDYINASSTKLVILKRTGHNHMAFSSIHHLTAELGTWTQSLG